MSQQEISVINLDQLVSMTSVEIAELTGKEHTEMSYVIFAIWLRSLTRSKLSSAQN